MRLFAPKRAAIIAAAFSMFLLASAFRPVKVKVPPPPPPDTSTNGFAKLVVKNLRVINGKEDDFGPTITADGRTMYFVSDRKGGKGSHDFYVTHSPENDDTTWFDPINLSEINTERADGAASIAADGQTLYFATERGTTVTGDVNIWVATLEGKDWKNVHDIGAPINTTKWESQPSISPDNKKLFFA